MTIEEYTSIKQELSTSNTELDNPEHADPVNCFFASILSLYICGKDE